MPNTKKRPCHKHSSEMLELAVDALRNKTMSSYEAEKAFGIPRRTLLDKLHNKHPGRRGCPTRLTDEEEANIKKVIIVAAEYGSPLTLLDLRVVVQRYLEANRRLSVFDNKLPGSKWARSFIKRHKSDFSFRMVQNIKRNRAEKSSEEMKEYFVNLERSLEGVPLDNIMNYDETNLTDNPGAQKCIFRRGVKYPERVVNYTKGAISIMFAITAGGDCLPPYVVYKAEHLYSQWTVNGPKGSRYNRSKSGWFDSTIFEDWFATIVLPWAKSKTGTKIVIGDNLASHINHKIVSYCEEHNIRFVFLPPNSSHLTQPLDVCYFGPLKKLWRAILLDYKIKNPRESTIYKGHFPDLLKKLMGQLNEKSHNIISAFKATGISPYSPEKVINKLPSIDNPALYSIDTALLDWLKEMRGADPTKRIRNKKLNVPPGKSVSTGDFKDILNQRKVKPPKYKNYLNTEQPTCDILLQTTSSPISNSPFTLIHLCIKSINAYMQDTEGSTSKSPTVLYLNEIKNDQTNKIFYNETPKCLQTNKKSKIVITSDVTIKEPFQNKLPSKKRYSNLKKKGVKISRSALHMELSHEINVANKRKAPEEIKQEIKKVKTEAVKRKPNNITMSLYTSKRTTNKKEKLNKQTKIWSDSESSIEMKVSETNSSDYETMDDFARHYQEEEQENIEPLINYGISDIEYFIKPDSKLDIDSWVLAKFVTKKSVKHFVGKVITIKDDVPEVKFVRKVKESKTRGSVFTYPKIDDICTMEHSEDIIKILPEPTISRRGQIIFSIDLSNYYNIQ